MLQKTKKWFQWYTKQFYTDNPTCNKNILLKAKHCIRVAKIISDIAFHEDFNDKEQELVQVMGLLHDIGRFEQYRQFKTFADHKSVNHGQLGVDILKQEKCLHGLSNEHQEWIHNAILFHNRPALPQNADQKILAFARLVRDADKIDIFHLSYNYFRQRTEKNKNTTLELHLDEREDITDKIYNSIMAGTLAVMKDIETLNDFKALQISWIFDINYQRSFKILRERKAIDKIYSTFPEGHSRAHDIYHYATQHLNQHAKEPSCTINS